jgi:predicted acetyltransferase
VTGVPVAAGSDRLEILDADDEDRWKQYVALARHSFGRPLPDLSHQRRHGVVRVVVHRSRTIAGAIGLPFAQYFGGRPVTAAGLSLVCVAPHARGAGVGRALVDALISALRQRGVVAVSLWSPSTGVYRRWGWEVAGTAATASFPAAAFSAGAGRAAQVVPDPDLDDVRRLQAGLARRWDGPVDRPTWWWDWKQASGPPDRAHFGLVRDDRLVAFLSCAPDSFPGWGHRLLVDDFWALDGDGLTGLCRFLSSHASQTRRVEFAPGVLSSLSDLAFTLPQHSARELGWYPWMLRLVSPLEALRLRGWPVSARARVGLRFSDGPEAGHHAVLTVEGGTAVLRPGGSGGVTVTERGLAAWYSGARSATQLARLGLLTGDPRDLDTLDSLVSGRTWLPDQF